MIVRFRGVRGSYSQSLRPQTLKRKISSVINRIRVDDLESDESRERFLYSLPESLFGTVGGHTACVEIETSESHLLVFDCGSGLRVLDEDLKKQRRSPDEIHIFFSHFHYDHLSGLPFFSYFYDPEKTVHFYSPQVGFEEILKRFMSKPYHPVGIDSFTAEIRYHELKGEDVSIGSAKVNWILRNHPDECYAYAIEEDSKKVIYSTDTELRESDFEKDPYSDDFFRKAEMIILDGQYTLGESIEKSNWGHTSFSMSVDFALEHQMSSLYLFHHDPLYDDSKLESILRSSRWYSHRVAKKNPLEIFLAREDSEVVI